MKQPVLHTLRCIRLLVPYNSVIRDLADPVAFDASAIDFDDILTSYTHLRTFELVLAIPPFYVVNNDRSSLRKLKTMIDRHHEGRFTYTGLLLNGMKEYPLP